MRGRLALVAGILASVVYTSLAVVPDSRADHHEISVREVFTGSASSPDLEYVMLQMRASGQNVFAGNGVKVVFYNEFLSTVRSASLTSNPANGQSQRYVLVGTENVATELGVTPDYSFADTDTVDNDGGAACFESLVFGGIDCVSWGDTSFIGTPPSPTGGDVSPAGITDGMAIRRLISRGCPTLLESVDDSNSPTDWSEATPAPFNNAAPAGGAPCPDTAITRRPPDRTTDRTPRLKFTSVPNGADFECRVDQRPYKGCDSPHTLPRLSLGGHTFRVRAVEGEGRDPTPARDKFKVISG